MSLSNNFPTVSPTLNLNFASAGRLDSRVTFTRSSTATYTNQIGLIQSAAVNEPRFDYDPVTLAAMGLLIEEQRTNLVTYSEQFDNAAWIKSSSGGGSAPVVTANAATAPDGTVTADQVVFVAPVSGDQSLIYQSPSTSAGTYTGSFYVKAASGSDVGKIIGFRHVQGGSYLLVTLTNSWARVTLTETRSTDNFEIILRPAVGTSSGTVTAYLWGAQLEAGSFATSYIKTEAATVTRSADVASVNTLSPWYSSTEGSFLFDFTTFATVSKTLAVAATSASNVFLYRSVDDAWKSWNGSSVSSFTGAFVQPNKIGLAMGATSAASINGAAAQSFSRTSVGSGSSLAIGNGEVGGTVYLNGHVRRIAFYPRRLTNAELQALTA